MFWPKNYLNEKVCFIFSNIRMFGKRKGKAHPYKGLPMYLVGTRIRSNIVQNFESCRSCIARGDELDDFA